MFRPESKVVNDLFGNDIKYKIPEYQRPYSWESAGKSEKDNQVNVMWTDIYSFFESGTNDTYFLGSMVLIGTDTGREYQVIDGQQRLTTLVLLFVAIKCFLQKIKQNNTYQDDKDVESYIQSAIEEMDTLIYNKKKFGAITTERKVKIERNMGFDYDVILDEATQCLEKPSYKPKELSAEQEKVASRYFRNRKYLESQLEENFLNENKHFSFEDAKKLNRFIDVLKNNVSAVRILTEDFRLAFHIFEILNNRGLPLANKDLFRNFLIKEFSALKKSEERKYHDLDPNRKWYSIEENHNLTDSFIGRMVESKNATQPRRSAFSELQELYEQGGLYEDTMSKRKIEIFYEDLQKELGYYTLISNPDDITDNHIAAKVKFLNNAGNERYSTNFMMALFRYFLYKGDSNKEINQFLTLYEQYYLNILLTPGLRFSYGPIYSVIADLNAGNIESASSKLTLSQEQKNDLKIIINESIRDNDLAKLLLSKYVWTIEANSENEDVVSQNYYFDKATLEHIIPQHPEAGTNWLKDFSSSFRQAYTYKLGNMTLLTTAKNSAARNFDFDKKKIVYQKTKLNITRELISGITESSIKERHQKIIKIIYENLDLS